MTVNFWHRAPLLLALFALMTAGCERDKRPQATLESPRFSGQSGLPKVVVLTTGGTIATRQDPTTHQPLPALSGEQLIAAVPELGSIAQVGVQEVAQVGSANMTPEIWQDLARRTDFALAQPDVTGVVITHGTDTLEETAFFLDLVTASTKPVVITGAQRMASDPEPDGPRNLRDAVRAAVAPEAAGKGALVVMNGEINAAREVTKTSTVDLDAFKSLEQGPLGKVEGNSVRFTRTPMRAKTFIIDHDARLPRVEIVAHYAGADGWQIRNLLSGGFLHDAPHLDGIVIAATGMGHVSAAMYDEIAKARNQGIPVVIATRVPRGPTMPRYHGKGLGSSLRDIGCIFVKDLSPQKARVLLMVAMMQTRDPNELQKYFE